MLNNSLLLKLTQKAAIKREKSQTCLNSSEREQARRSQLTDLTDFLLNVSLGSAAYSSLRVLRMTI